jgi:hypothetical protein
MGKLRTWVRYEKKRYVGLRKSSCCAKELAELALRCTLIVIIILPFLNHFPLAAESDSCLEKKKKKTARQSQ